MQLILLAKAKSNTQAAKRVAQQQIKKAQEFVLHIEGRLESHEPPGT
jgi:hypothetical protein